jgi:GNAT superfamily N-acetyltransferase
VTPPLTTEHFDRRHHNIAGFSSGRPELDDWLKRYAGQGERRDTTRTFVRAQADGTVIAYYTLVATTVERDKATPAVAAGTPTRFPIPACLIARLAVDHNQQGQGLGSSLLRDALRRVLLASEHVAIRAVAVDAIDATAAAFYTRHGFTPLTALPLRLQVPLSDVRATVT